MRRSSSTIRRWGASSESAAGRAVIVAWPSPARAARPLGERVGDAGGLQVRQPQRKLGPFGRDIEQPLAAVELAFLLLDIAEIDQLLEHPAKRLLGDLENVQELGNLHARIAIDEMQYPVMGAAEAEFHQDVVGIADEIAIGEKQQLDDVPDRLRP